MGKETLSGRENAMLAPLNCVSLRISTIREAELD